MTLSKADSYYTQDYTHMAQAGLGWRVPYGAGNAEQTGRELPAPVAAPLLPAGCERNCCRLQQFQPGPMALAEHHSAPSLQAGLGSPQTRLHKRFLLDVKHCL